MVRRREAIIGPNIRSVGVGGGGARPRPRCTLRHLFFALSAAEETRKKNRLTHSLHAAAALALMTCVPDVAQPPIERVAAAASLLLRETSSASAPRARAWAARSEGKEKLPRAKGGKAVALGRRCGRASERRRFRAGRREFEAGREVGIEVCVRGDGKRGAGEETGGRPERRWERRPSSQAQAHLDHVPPTKKKV